MAKLRQLPPRLPAAQPRLRTLPKTKDRYYYSAAFAALALACLNRDGWRCVVCGDGAVVCDHIVSRRQGGEDVLTNTRSLCNDCDHRLKESWAGSRPDPSVILDAIRRGDVTRPKQPPGSVERRRRDLLSQAKRRPPDEGTGIW